jgi:hypothetical protein
MATVVIAEFMQQGITLTSEVYCGTLEKLCRAIQNKRHAMLLTFGVLIVLLHDNVHPHTAASTQALLKNLTTLLKALISLQETNTHLTT